MASNHATDRSAPAGTAALPRPPQVGDVVIVTGRHIPDGRVEATVTDVRRKYFRAEWRPGFNGSSDFEIASGTERSSGGGFSNYLAVARTPTQVEHDDAIDAAEQVLKDGGLVYARWRRLFSDAALFAIADILSKEPTCG